MKIVHILHPHQWKRDEIEPTVMALGFFDGIHLGHKKVISTAKKIADEKGYKSAVMTFYPHPSVVLSKDNKQEKYITPLYQKERLIEEMGIDTLYILNFNEEFAGLGPQEFVDHYITGLHVKHVVAGFDYSYGRFGEGTMETLPHYSRDQFEQTVIQKVEREEEKVSSTLLRAFIQVGDVASVPSVLGRLYSIEGIVVDGDKRGRTIGFPTANVQVDEEYLIPAVGVYAVTIKVRDSWYNGMCNIGFKPTFHNNLKQATVEVNIFDFNEDIYNDRVEVCWHSRIRSEKKFNGIQELIAQLNKDKESVKQYFWNTLAFCNKK